MRKLYIWLFLLVGAVLFFVFATHFAWADVLRLITEGDRTYMAMYLGASVAILLLNALRWQTVLAAKGFTIPFRNTLSYHTAKVAVAFVTPGPKIAAEAIRAGLLSRHTVRGRKIRTSRALSTVLLDRAVELQTFAALFFFMVTWFALFGAVPAGIKYTLIVLSTLLLVMVLLAAYNISRGKPFFLRMLKRVGLGRKFTVEIKHFEEAIVSFYQKDRKQFMTAHIIAACAWFLAFVEYKYLLLLLGIDMSLFGVFIVYSFVGLAYMVPVPLALGALETSQAAAFALLGLAPATGIALALITRMRDILFTIVGFIVLLYYGIAPRKLPAAIR
jgi:glycosyltransferase 2 family protein